MLTLDVRRLSLAYKGLPYKSAWVEFPDIPSTCKKLGVAHTGLSPSGEPAYTVPFIYDPNTDRHISDSAAIAKYLDETYPATPKLFPAGTDALQRAFTEAERIIPGVTLELINEIVDSVERVDDS